MTFAILVIVGLNLLCILRGYWGAMCLLGALATGLVVRGQQPVASQGFKGAPLTMTGVACAIAVGFTVAWIRNGLGLRTEEWKRLQVAFGPVEEAN